MIFYFALNCVGCTKAVKVGGAPAHAQPSENLSLPGRSHAKPVRAP